MLGVINKIVSSSLSMAFLGVLSWSAAYSYCWGQACFYGFPLWYVDVGAGNVARSLGYVFYVTAVLCTTYLIGLLLLTKAKPFLSESCIKLVRATILCALATLPILIISTLLNGKIYQQAVISYFCAVLLFIIALRNVINRHISNINIYSAIQFFQSHKSNVLIFTYAYFVIFAFMVGYLRPHFKTRFDMIEINAQMYYVLAKYNKTFILSKELKIDNDEFYLYELNPNQLGHIQIVDAHHPFGLQ